MLELEVDEFPTKSKSLHVADLASKDADLYFSYLSRMRFMEALEDKSTLTTNFSVEGG